MPVGASAQQPAPRGASRLLVRDREGEERHRRIADLPSLLRPGDLLVVNDTRVLPARLYGRVVRGAPPATRELEPLLVERLGEREWEGLARPGRRARPGPVIAISAPPAAPEAAPHGPPP